MTSTCETRLTPSQFGAFSGRQLRRCGLARDSPATPGQQDRLGHRRRREGQPERLGGFGAGDDFLLTGAYSQNAVWYSGHPEMMWGEDGQVNGNGQPMYLADAYFNPLTNQWSNADAHGRSRALLEHHFTPQFYLDLEGRTASQLEQHGRRLQLLRLRRAASLRRPGPLSPQRDDLDRRRRPRLEPGHQPELRPRADVSGHAPGSRRAASSERSTMSAASAARFSRLAIGMATRTASPAVCASPVTSDRSRSVETKAPEQKLRGFLFGLGRRYSAPSVARSAGTRGRGRGGKTCLPVGSACRSPVCRTGVRS